MKKYLKDLLTGVLVLSLGAVCPMHADECYVEQEPECSNFGCRDALMLGGAVVLGALAGAIASHSRRGGHGDTGPAGVGLTGPAGVGPTGPTGPQGLPGATGSGFELPRGEGGLTFRVADFELDLFPSPFPEGVEIIFYVMAPDSTLTSQSLGIFTKSQDVTGTTITILADAVFGDYEVGLQFTNNSLDQGVIVLVRELQPGRRDSLFEVEASRDQSVTELVDYVYGYRSTANLSPNEQAQFSLTFTYGLGDIP